ncbi:putative tubulin-specific chaperone c [Massariosphaeria phaeospora]|uniref:Putative tubulin-specific chaperone c n=1 Tax=Massariosphaeria phaeospora TaxID=100035 RepID=A0A7C8IBC0_9PLEO|nr:putative tubulin-specific chaperone c [Massariosphaeria phaeospora]
MATSPAVQAQSELGSKERFFRYFQTEVTALQEQMECLNVNTYTGSERNDAVENCLASIGRLSHEVKDASSYIPAYDQRTYSETIKALSEKLQAIRNTFNPPKKFQFKSARKTASATSTDSAQKWKIGASVDADSSDAPSSVMPTPLQKSGTKTQLAVHHTVESAKADDVDGMATTQASSLTDAYSVTISNRDRTHVRLPTGASHATSSGTISNLRHCVVELYSPAAHGPSFAGLTLKNIKESLVVCGQVLGPAHITGVEDSVILVSCRQFRMHGSKNVVVYLHCASRPIIEDCEDIRFAPLPDAYVTEDIGLVQNHWDEIDDFKWLKFEPSPHFRLLSTSDRIRDEVWMNNVSGAHDLSVDDILHAVEVPRS